MNGLVLTPDQFKALQSTLKELGFRRVSVDTPGTDPFICPHCGGNCMIYVSYMQESTRGLVWREYHFCIDCWHAIEDFTTFAPERAQTQ